MRLASLWALACAVVCAAALQPQVGRRWVSNRPSSQSPTVLWGQKGGFPSSSGRPVSALRFKVSEDEETDLDEEDAELDFGQNEGSRGDGAFLRKLSRGVVPLAASLGFVVTPSPAVAVRVAGAAVGGLAGILAKRAILSNLASRIDTSSGGDDGSGGGDGSDGPTAVTVRAALKAMASGPPTSDLDLKKLEAIARKHGVAGEDLAEFFTFVFAEVVTRAVTEDDADITDLSEVVDFAERVGLTQSEVADGFTLAALRMGSKLERDQRGFFTEDYPAELLLQASKVFFLADKMIGTSEGYYGKRMAVSLSFFTTESFQEVISEACSTLYKRCVQSVMLSPNDFTAEEVERLKAFITTSASVSSYRPADMKAAIADALQSTLDAALTHASAESARLDNYSALQRAQQILGWSSKEFTSTVETRTLPVFETAVRQIVDEALEHPDRVSDLSERLQERISALQLDPLRARVAVTDAVSAKNSEYMNRIDKVYNASGGSVEPAFKIMAQYADSHQALTTLVKPVMDGIDLPIPGLPFADMVRVSMFKLQLERPQGSKNIDSEMFSLSEEQQQIVRKNLALPKVSSWITQCISEGNFAEGAKAAYEKLLGDYSITPESPEWKSTAVDFYYQEVLKISKTRAIPSSVDFDRLQELRAFLGVADEAVERVHVELFGEKFVKAVSEAMTPSGVIAEEYKDGLERLRLRLSISPEGAKDLLGFAARLRLGPVIKDLVEIWKSDSDSTKRAEKKRAEAGGRDKSRDPISSLDNVLGFMETGAQKEGGGPNVFMREALNLVDFFAENYLSDEDRVDIKNVKAVPVTAVGVVPEGDLAGLFKHYLITRLSEADPVLRQRYVDNERLFSMLLGLSEDEAQKVRESLAFSAYKNMLKSILVYKDAVESQDLQQFASLKEQLGLDQAVADRVLRGASREALSEHAAEMIRPRPGQKRGDITAEQARRFRGQVLSLGMDVQKDTGFNEKVVTLMYALEVQFAIENDLTDELAEIQEGYGIPSERAAAIVEATAERFVSQLLNLALRAAKKYDERECVKWTNKVSTYASFITGTVLADGNLFSEDDKARLLSFFEGSLKLSASEGGAGQGGVSSAEQATEATERLRHLIVLSEDFVPPIEGIDGLLGSVKGVAGQTEADRKPWAWG